MTTDPIERVRQICLALPESTERLSHGAPSFFVRDRKQFATVHNGHHDTDWLALWCAAPAGAQDALVAGDPNRYFVPPYVGHRGWLGVRLDRRPPWGTIEDLIEDAYREVAPVTLVRRLDGGD